MAVSIYSKAFTLLRRHVRVHKTQNRTGYIILLPEVDPEMADRAFSFRDELPIFTGLTAEKLGMVMGKQLLDHECTVRNIDRQIEDSPDSITDIVTDILDPIEKSVVQFSKVWGVVRTLYLTNNKLMPPPTYFSLHSRALSSKDAQFRGINTYKLLKNVDRSKLTEEQCRLVDKYLIEGHLNGFDCSFTKRQQMEMRTQRMGQEQIHFRIRVESARKQYFLKFNNPAVIEDFPENLIKDMLEPGANPQHGPWTVQLNYGIGERFLEYCPDRDMRWNVWQGENKAASNAEDERDLANSVSVEKIRYYRYQKAQTLGYKVYTDVAIKTKMVSSWDEVNSLLELYREAGKHAQHDEVVKLQKFADSEGFEYPIQLWDVPFWSRIQKMELYNFESEKLRPYFPYQRVMNGLFALCDRVLGITFREVKGVDVWHPDVRFFQVYENGDDKAVGGFYLDPFERGGKMKVGEVSADVVPIRHSSRVGKCITPLTALIMNLPRPTPQSPPLLSFSEVKLLFSLFGYNLQNLLSQTTYSDLSGLNNVEMDASAVCSRFMVNWLYDKDTFYSIHGHYQTGEQLEVDMEGVQKHMAGYRLCRELYKAKLDILMHEKPQRFWVDLVNDIWDDHFIFPLSNYHSDPCRYVDIFCTTLGAGYYSHVWSDMLAADVFKAFSENKSDHANIGARFRDTFLTFGGSCHPKEVFRRFRGRDPCPEAYLDMLGLTSPSKVVPPVEPVENTDSLNIAV